MQEGAGPLPLQSAPAAWPAKGAKLLKAGRLGHRPNKPAEPPGRQQRLGAKPKGAKLLKAGRLGRRPNKPAEPPSRQQRLGAKPKGAKLLKAERLGRRPNKPAEPPSRQRRLGAKPKGAKLLKAGRLGHRPNKPAETPSRQRRLGAKRGEAGRTGPLSGIRRAARRGQPSVWEGCFFAFGEGARGGYSAGAGHILLRGEGNGQTPIPVQPALPRGACPLCAGDSRRAGDPHPRPPAAAAAGRKEPAHPPGAGRGADPGPAALLLRPGALRPAGGAEPRVPDPALRPPGGRVRPHGAGRRAAQCPDPGPGPERAHRAAGPVRRAGAGGGDAGRRAALDAGALRAGDGQDHAAAGAGARPEPRGRAGGHRRRARGAGRLRAGRAPAGRRPLHGRHGQHGQGRGRAPAHAVHGAGRDRLGRDRRGGGRRRAAGRGVQVLCSAHAVGFAQAKRRPALEPLLRAGVFDRIVVLGGRVGRIAAVLDGEGRPC